MTNIIGNFDYFKVSMTSAGILTVYTPLFERFLPFILQICLILSLQIIAVGVDYIRTKYKLKPREKEDSEIKVNTPN